MCMLRSIPVQRQYLHVLNFFKNRMWCLKVNENKITIDNDFNRNFLEDGDKT